jgi:uncharacterized membrane protein required for colicin V production
LGRIEVLWGILMTVFGVVGLVRGFLKELGVTTVLLVTLFGFDRAGEKMGDLLLEGLSMARVSLADDAAQSATRASFYIAALMAVTFISYHGETLTFEGQSKGSLGVFLGLLIGLVNGYLVVGSIWYYLNKFDYPFGLVSQPLSSAAQQLVQVLPPNLLSPFLPFLVVFMVIIRVIR